MKTFLRRTGLLFGGAGTAIFLIALISFYMGPYTDHTGAGEIYDQFVEEYNKQLEENIPDHSIPAMAKTRLELHREDTIFGMGTGILVLITGLFLYFKNKPATP